jgi:hypothetical protein
VAVTEQARARVVYRPPDQRAARPVASLGRLGVLALVALVFSGGLVLGRWTGRPVAEPGAAPSPATATPTQASGPAASSGPATATQTAPANPAASAQAGPRAVVNGVGAGWAHSRLGAWAAATDYATVLSGGLAFDAPRRHKAVAVLAAPEVRAPLQRSLDGLETVLRKNLRLPATGPVADKVILRTVPLGWDLVRYDGRTAQVAIWTTGLAGSTTGVQVVQMSGITTVDLRWVGGDWKQVKASTVTGPTPLAPESEVPSAATAFTQQTQRFKEFDHAPAP